ncbi:hypothetical protein HDU97_010079 [Phlyctochytrium planicorne]|nr:hypothetical protein HDU97_010079 [Phlyctochytrium planicorne]
MLFLSGPSKSILARKITSDWDVAVVEDNGEDLPSNAKDPTLIMIKSNVGSHLFVALTKNIVYLWSTRPHVMLSKVIRSDITLLEDGENQDVIWKPDSSAFVVITNKGFLHFYDVIFENSRSLEFQFSSSHHYVSGPGERGGVPSISIRFKMALEIDTGVQCGLGLPDELLLCTVESPSILSLSWQGIVNTDGTVSLTELEFYEDPEKSLGHVVSNMEMDLFGWISTDGKAFVTQRIALEYPDHEHEEEEEFDLPTYTWVGLCFYNVSGDEIPACTIAINSRYLLVAVGDICGQVNLYSLSDDRSELRFSHRLSFGFLSASRQANLGAVRSLQWSTDCSTLAVGWSTGGFSVWTVFGRLITSTLSDDGGPAFEQLSAGVSDLFWSNFELFVLPHVKFNSEILVFPFLMSPLVRCFTMSNVQKVLLISDDRLLLYEGNATDFDPMNVDLMQWESVQYTSYNDSGTNIAIAGRRGIAHYNTNSNKWKLFGNEIQEQSFTVSSGGILWYDDIIIASTEDTSTWDHELRFFSREANLDSKCLHIEPMADTIIAMSSIGSNLLIFSADNVLRYFSIVKMANGQRLRLELHQQILLDGVVTNPFAVHSVAWNCHISDPSVDSLKKAPILLLKSGELSELRELADGGWEHIGLSEKVEYFWLSHDEQMKNSLWAVDGHGIKIWLNVDENFLENGAEDFIQIPLDFYPLCSKTKTHLFLPAIIRYLLTKNAEDLALAFANQYIDYEYFYHSLEILLHQVLDEESDSYLGFAEGAILPRLSKFLENFPNYLDVIVQCARKTEVSVWEYFFSIVGDAKGLFQKCLEAGNLRSATSYLIIIQTLEPVTVSGKLAVDLLERTFELEDFEIGKELIRFFSSIEGNDGYSLNEVIKNTVMKYSLDIDIPLSDNSKDNKSLDGALYHMEILLSKHARKLLIKRRIKSLGRFTSLLSFPLVRWLKRERNRSAMIQNWTVVLGEIHQQFDLPYPNDYWNTRSTIYMQTKGERRKTLTNPLSKDDIEASATKNPSPQLNPLQINTAGTVDTEPGPRSAPPTLNPNPLLSPFANDGTIDLRTLDLKRQKIPYAKPEVIKEIRFLVDSTKDALCYPWSLLLASSIMDSDSIVSILEQSPDHKIQWRTALLSNGSKGYEELVAVVDEALINK